jgi:hypothetical protein
VLSILRLALRFGLVGCCGFRLQRFRFWPNAPALQSYWGNSCLPTLFTEEPAKIRRAQNLARRTGADKIFSDALAGTTMPAVVAAPNNSPPFFQFGDSRRRYIALPMPRMRRAMAPMM